MLLRIRAKSAPLLSDTLSCPRHSADVMHCRRGFKMSLFVAAVTLLFHAEIIDERRHAACRHVLLRD